MLVLIRPRAESVACDFGAKQSSESETCACPFGLFVWQEKKPFSSGGDSSKTGNQLVT